MDDKLLKSLCRDMEDYNMVKEVEKRRLWLVRTIEWIETEEAGNQYMSATAWVAQQIMRFNREDMGKPIGERKPIILYINCPGGDSYEGLMLISAIELSKTPIYTVVVGKSCSMAFLIGLCGDYRLAFPNAIFLLHDGQVSVDGTTGKVNDTIEFYKKMETEFFKKLVLKHSHMKSKDYNKIKDVEYYMTAKEAL
ncbi:ATP-dependent Clp protease proteolytic subunit [Candidatus Saccharibacteria bacterium]|nr:ATP-dependent Clp protease proteolytic subunit [Candidatus Saccharibacteria bacterium]